MSLNKILIHLKALLWESIILVLPPPAAKRTLLQHYCTTIAQYTPPSPSPPSLAIPYAILVMAISCKGQHTTGRTPPFRYCLGRGAVTLGPFASRPTRYAADPPLRYCTHISLNKILIHFKALLWESIILVLPFPAAKRTLFQHYCTTITQYTPPSPSPPSLAIPYAILVMAISCKG